MLLQGPGMLDRTFQPFAGAIKHLNKDVMLACALSERLHVRTSVSDAASATFQRAKAAGWGEEDVSAVLKAVLAGHEQQPGLARLGQR